MAYTLSCTLVLVKNAKKKRLSTGQQYFLLHTKTHTHTCTYIHVKFVQADDCNNREWIKMHCPTVLRSTDKKSGVKNTVEKQDVN